MPVLRYLNLLSLAVWIGGLIFFAFVLAPTVFAVLPTHQLAGNVVNRSLSILHWMGLSCGVVFAVTSMLIAYLTEGAAQQLALRNVIIFLMIGLTLIGMFVIQPRMWTLRQEMGIIDELQQGDSRRVEFNRLHVWSTRVEGAVLILGLGLLFLVSRRLS